MMYFICYDITEPKRLKKVSKTLENYGLRVQYSFFQCEMDKDILQNLRDELLGIIDLKTDSLKVYPMCEDCMKNTTSIGNGELFIPQRFLIL